MPDPSLEDLALAISRWAAARPLITRVYVFGSRIRGCTWTGEPVRRNSDLDVAIELVEIDSENLASAFFDHAQGLEQELASLVPWRVDAQPYTPSTNLCLQAYVAAYHRLVYER